MSFFAACNAVPLIERVFPQAVKRRSLLGVYGRARNPLIVWNRLHPNQNGVGSVDRLLAFACGPSETAGPLRLRSGQSLRYATSDFLSRKSGSAPVGMTKLRGVAHLGTSGGGWTESKKLIWTRLTLSRPLRRAQGRLFGTPTPGPTGSHADSEALAPIFQSLSGGRYSMRNAFMKSTFDARVAGSHTPHRAGVFLLVVMVRGNPRCGTTSRSPTESRELRNKQRGHPCGWPLL
jgi:hypothetical protein